MDEFIRWSFTSGGDERTMVGIVQVIGAMLLSFSLSLVIAYIYRVTHVGVSYSQSMVKTFILMSVVVSVIMIIIGSNIARAFSLVGALSIIRFRTAVKDATDVAFIFLTMAIGMACGTGFWDIAVVLTATSVALIYFMYRFDIGAEPMSEMILKMRVSQGVDPEKEFAEIFYKYLKNYAMLSAESTGESDALELVFSIELKPRTTAQELILELQKRIGEGKVQLITGLSNVNI